MARLRRFCFAAVVKLSFDHRPRSPSHSLCSLCIHLSRRRLLQLTRRCNLKTTQLLSTISTNWLSIVIWIGLPVLAGYLAHKKGRNWIIAAALTVSVPPLGILWVLLRSPHPNSGLPTNTKAKILFGLLPLWASIIVMIAGSLVSGSPDYWNVAPWIVIFAIPACAITLVMVEAAGRRKARETRSDGRA